MTTYLSWPEQLHYRALFTIHVLAPLAGVFDPWPGLNEPDAEAARCHQVAESLTKCIVEISKAESIFQNRGPGECVGETVGEDTVISWRYEGGHITTVFWMTKPMYVTGTLRERSAQLQCLRVPKEWTAEDGRKFVEGVGRLMEKSVEVFAMGEAWKITRKEAAQEDVVEEENFERNATGREHGLFELALRPRYID